MAEPDSQLVGLITGLNRSTLGDRFSVTVWVGGAVITGMAIAAGEYWKAMADMVRVPAGGEGSEALAEVYATWADREVSAALDPEPELDIEEEEPAEHLHLRDAQIVSDGVAVGPPMLWRCRLDNVDAWTFVALKPWDDDGMHPA